MEQEINSLEIAIKKVTGSPLHDRYKSIVCNEIKAIIFGMLLSILTVLIMKDKCTYELVVIGAVLCSVDMTILFKESDKWDKVSLQKIMKGGAL